VCGGFWRVDCKEPDESVFIRSLGDREIASHVAQELEEIQGCSCFGGWSFIGVSVHAQVAGGTMLGTVTDASGAVVAGAQVTMTDIASGVSRVVPTDGNGSYSAANLLPGNYSIMVSAPGFDTEVQSGINLTVGAQILINLKLKPGATQETIQVHGSTPGVELTTSIF
jgi:hypothetical protein